MKVTHLESDRVLLAEMDSVEQRRTLSGDDWLQRLRDPENPVLLDALGLLRFESLLSQHIVLTDAQALDGRVILGLVLSGLITRLTPEEHVLPLEIRIRKPSLKRTAWAMVDAGQGSAFRSSFLTNGVDVQAASLTIPGEGHRIPSMSNYLRNAGADPTEVDALGDGWRAVGQLVRRGHLSLRTWEADRDWPSMVALSTKYLPLENLARALRVDSRSWLHELSTISDRSTFLGQVQAKCLGEDDTRAIVHWFDERYRRATAFQHRADYRAIHSGAVGEVYIRSLDRLVQTPRTTFIELPAGFIQDLGRLPAYDWRAAYLRNRPLLRSWWNHGEKSSLERALDDVRETLDEGPPGESKNLVRGLVSVGRSVIGNLAQLPQDPNVGGIVNVTLIAIGVEASGHLLESQLGGTTVKVTDHREVVDPS